MSRTFRTLLSWCLRRVVLFPQLIFGIRYYRVTDIDDPKRRGWHDEETYRCFEYQFRHRAPLKYWLHNKYFKENNRGFGEPAFHSFWIQLFKQFQPQNCLEIGVYRGQTISLWKMLQIDCNILGQIVGITPLSNEGDSVSTYLELNYRNDILNNFEIFQLPKPILAPYTSTSAEAIELIESVCWDLIYIDGSHDIDVVTTDFNNAYRSLSVGGLLVMDDSSKYMDSLEHLGAFSGHHGPSIVAETLAKTKMRHIIRVGHLNLFQKVAEDDN